MVNRDYYTMMGRAHVAVHNAIKSGKIRKGPCAICGNRQIEREGHHFDYHKPLEVIWLCLKHHNLVHSALMYKKPLLRIVGLHKKNWNRPKLVRK